MAQPQISTSPSEATAAISADREALRDLVRRLRDRLAGQPLTAGEAAARVADELRESLPGPDLLTSEQRRGSPDHYDQHVLHVEDDGSFSIVALVWRPGQETPIHDHVSWCVVAVIDGTEHETVYDVHEDAGAPYLVATGSHRNTAGSVCSFAPPGDVHSVRNAGDRTAISLHVYGADISVLGTSIRRSYDVPVRRP